MPLGLATNEATPPLIGTLKGMRSLSADPPLMATTWPPLGLIPRSLTPPPWTVGVSGLPGAEPPKEGDAPKDGDVPGVQIISLGVPGVPGVSGVWGVSTVWADCPVGLCSLEDLPSSIVFFVLSLSSPFFDEPVGSNISNVSANFLVSSSNISMKDSSSILSSSVFSFELESLSSFTLMSFIMLFGRSSNDSVSVSASITMSSSLAALFSIGTDTGLVLVGGLRTIFVRATGRAWETFGLVIGLTGRRPGLATSSVGRLRGMLGLTPGGSLVTNLSDGCLVLTATRLGLEAPDGSLGLTALNPAPSKGDLVIPGDRIVLTTAGRPLEPAASLGGFVVGPIDKTLVGPVVVKSKALTGEPIEPGMIPCAAVDMMGRLVDGLDTIIFLGLVANANVIGNPANFAGAPVFSGDLD